MITISIQTEKRSMSLQFNFIVWFGIIQKRINEFHFQEIKTIEREKEKRMSEFGFRFHQFF